MDEGNNRISLVHRSQRTNLQHPLAPERIEALNAGSVGKRLSQYPGRTFEVGSLPKVDGRAEALVLVQYAGFVQAALRWASMAGMPVASPSTSPATLYTPSTMYSAP